MGFEVVVLENSLAEAFSQRLGEVDMVLLVLLASGGKLVEIGRIRKAAPAPPVVVVGCQTAPGAALGVPQARAPELLV